MAKTCVATPEKLVPLKTNTRACSMLGTCFSALIFNKKQTISKTSFTNQNSIVHSYSHFLNSVCLFLSFLLCWPCFWPLLFPHQFLHPLSLHTLYPYRIFSHLLHLPLLFNPLLLKIGFRSSFCFNLITSYFHKGFIFRSAGFRGHKSSQSILEIACPKKRNCIQ